MSDEISREEALRSFDAAMAVAKATPCPLQGCDGSLHEPFVDPSEWSHSLPDRKFDGGAVVVGIWTNDLETFTCEVLTRESSDMTATQLRAMADLYEGYPAFLRAAAVELDALNKGQSDDHRR
jgi:hypothetical protein